MVTTYRFKGTTMLRGRIKPKTKIIAVNQRTGDYYGTTSAGDGIFKINVPDGSDRYIVSAVHDGDDGLYPADPAVFVQPKSVTVPQTVRDYAFTGSDSGVYAVANSDGSLNWSDTTLGSSTTSPAYSNGTIYIGGGNNAVDALNATDGSSEWTYDTGGGVFASPAVVGGTVYVGSQNGSMDALNASDGSLEWSTTLGNEIQSSPAVVGGVVYNGSNNGDMYALDAADGSEIWSFATGNEAYSSPAVVG